MRRWRGGILNGDRVAPQCLMCSDLVSVPLPAAERGGQRGAVRVPAGAAAGQEPAAGAGERPAEERGGPAEVGDHCRVRAGTGLGH